VIELSKALKDRQLQQDDPGCLPKVGLEDVPSEITFPKAEKKIESPTPINSYASGTNGIVYQEMVCQLPELSDDELTLLPLLTHVWTELGLGQRSYLDVQQWQSAVSGGLHSAFRMQSLPENQFKTKGLILLNGKALKRNHSQLCELMQATLETLRFDENERVRELVAHARARSENSITGNGHALAMGAAAQFCSPAAKLSYRTNGLEGIQQLKQLDQRLNEEQQLIQLMSQLEALHKKILTMPRELLVIGEQQELAHYQANMQKQMSVSTHTSNAPEYLDLPFSESHKARELWIANSQVNFCAKAYATVPSSHEDAAALTVLGGFLRNSFLHTAIREQGGAYGGGATQDNYNGAFRFFSYRDPRMEETLADFDQSIHWLLDNSHDQRLLEEACLGVIASLDKPGSPAGEAKQAFHGTLFGRDKAVRKIFRERVMSVSLNDLKRVTETYLKEENAHIAVLTGNHGEAKADHLELEIKRL